jgi:DtxR family Mn-dependent transcriptional regulator
MPRSQPVSSHHEDYLETMAVLQKKHGWVRVRDIAATLDVKASSVNTAIKILSKNGLVEYEKYGRIELSEKGRLKARSVQKRHDLLTLFLTKTLRLDPKTAAVDSCKMEHVISTKTCEALQRFMQGQNP